MKSSKGQLSAILILILALFIQMEGMIPKGLMPNIFAGSEDPIILVDEVDGVELKAEIDSKSFSVEKELLIKAFVTNKSSKPIQYFPRTNSYGQKEVMGITLCAMDGKSSFADKYNHVEKHSTDIILQENTLEPGKVLSNDFSLLPYYKENGSVKHVSTGEYIFSLWYSREAGEITKAEFPVKVIKRFGRMYIKL